jgi:hypothetical protein
VSNFLDPPPSGLTAAATDTRYPRMGNIVSAGAVADGSDVDARPVLDAILADSLTAGRGIAHVPMGFYRLKTPFNPTQQGAGATPALPKLLRGFTWFAGWGKIGYPPSGGGFPNGSTKYFAGVDLIWYGADAATMWELDSVVGMAHIGMGWRGRPTKGATNRAGIGVNISQRNLGLPGSGLHLFDRCHWSDLAVGVKFGEGQITGGGNCDTTSWRDCTWQDCDAAIFLTHQQNLVYNLGGTSGFVGCTTVIRADKGGYFNIDDLNANGCGGAGADDWMLDLSGGINTGTNKVSRARVEGGCQKFVRLRGGYCELLLEGFTEAQDNQASTMFQVFGGQLTLIGGKLASHDLTSPTFYVSADFAAGRHGSVRLQGVRLAADKFEFAEWFDTNANSIPRIVLRDCELDSGERIPSMSTRLEDQLPVPLRAKTTNGTSTVSTTLRNNGAAGRYDNCCAVPQGMYRIRVTIMAGTLDGAGALTGINVRAEREFDVLHTASALTVSGMTTVGVDVNPDSLSYAVASSDTWRHLRVDVVGKASTTLAWQADFQLVGGYHTGSL